MAAYSWGSCVQNGVPTLACIPHIFTLVINTAIGLLGFVSVLWMMWSGVRMIIARGDAKELDSAHQAFFYSFLGLLVVLFSFLIVNIIAYVTGVTCINQFGFNSCISIPVSTSGGGGGTSGKR